MTSDPLHLTILGSATPYPSPDNPCSGYLASAGDTRVWIDAGTGYLASAGDTRVWIDAGTGTLAQLRRHTQLDELDAIWISHLHADHSADLLTAFYGALYSDIRLPAPIPLFGPPGIADRLAHFLTNTPVRSPIESAFKIHELHDGHRVQLDSLTLTTSAVTHGMPAFALRIDTAAGSLTYSGDTAPCAPLTSLAANSDVLLCEADLIDHPTDEEPLHHTPEDAGNTATAAKATRLIITHISPFLTPTEAITRATTRYSGRIDYATPGTTFTIDNPAKR
ncbi:MBL fold metallo-hydrolase [Nocardia sp. GCM10030253]|uniref:MBL fold metallo-hydrolase n=1 Tax=Nocardia sp. GCM10030253 TaxID=3273404 RepID=UPI0036277218